MGGILGRCYRGLIYVLPVVLFFGYWPWWGLGANNTMNFELSAPLIWLVVFDVFSAILITYRKAWRMALAKWKWLILPVFLTVSLAWTRDFVRGFLILGVLWALYFAAFSIVVFRDEIGGRRFRKNLYRVSFIAAIGVSVWCVLQSMMDVMGVPQEYTLLCKGCVYQIFGFPHPNGFAAEPQFMGNLLLAPIILSLYLWMKGDVFGKRWMIAVFFVCVMALFLTLSRGAIYAFMVALVFFTIAWRVQDGGWQALRVWPVVVLAALAALNLQGIFAETSKTNDTYISGVSKAVNQLTLGVIDLGGSQVKKENVNQVVDSDKTESKNDLGEGRDDMNSTGDADGGASVGEEALFDGYVEVSTTNRLTGWIGALKTWGQNPQTVLFGVGMGGGLMAMYENGAMDSSREIVNNQYVNILLESGLVGALLLAYSLFLIYKATRRLPHSIMIHTLLVAYGVSLLFFSGLPNALQIYLLPVLLSAVV